MSKLPFGVKLERDENGHETLVETKWVAIKYIAIGLAIFLLIGWMGWQ